MKKRRLLALVLSAATFAGTSPAEAPVADAARRGDVEGVRALLRGGADVNEPHGDGMTALHWAAEQDNAELGNILVYAGARLDAGTRIGLYTPLHIASREGSASVVRLLLEAGADAEAATSNSGARPLHLAARAGNSDVVAMLLEHGAAVDAREDAWGQTPLTFAASLNRVEVIDLLLEAGADPNATSEAVDVVERAAADAAADGKLRAVLQEFRAQEGGGPDWKPSPAQVQAAVDLARQVQLRWPDVPGNEPDEESGPEADEEGENASPENDEAAAQDADADGEDDAPSSESASEADATDEESAEEGGEEEAAPASEENDEPQRPLSYAQQVGAWGGLAPIHHAVRQGHVAATLALLEGGADIDGRTGDNTTPILLAAINGQWDLASVLLEAGADPNLASNAGATPLYAVIERQWQPRASYAHPTEHQRQETSHLQMMERLLEAGADPDARLDHHLWYMEYTFGVLRGSGINLEGATPFWRAAYALDLEAMRLLTAWGADATVATRKPPQRQRRATPMEEEEPAEGEGTAEPGETIEESAQEMIGDTIPLGEAESESDPEAEGEAGQEPENESPESDEDEDKSGLDPVPVGGPAIYPLHAAAGVGYGQSFAGNAHRYVPNGWMPAVRFLVEEMGADVNARDSRGYTALHHAASRGDIEMILYLVERGADVTVVSRKGETTADMANGPVQRVRPYPEAVALLEELGAVNNQNCVSCE